MASDADSSKNKLVLNVYLGLTNGLAFFDFAQKVFGAKELSKKLSEDGKSVFHGEIEISGCTIMYSDGSQESGVTRGGAMIYVDNCDEIYKKALAEGATSVMEPSDQSYGRASGVKDPFGTTWWITTAPKKDGEANGKDADKCDPSANYQPVMPYLILKDAPKFLEFVKKVFNAEEAMNVKREDGKTIMHAEAVIAGYTIMIGEGSEEMGYQPGQISITVVNVDDNYNKAIEEGSTSVMPPADYPWGRFCGFKDPNGNTWWVNNPPAIEKRPAPEENAANQDPETQEPDVEKKVKTA